MGDRKIQIAAALLLLALLACAGKPGATTGPGGNGTMTIDALEGKTWVLTQLDEGHPMPAEPAITVMFEKGKISGSGGCNQYFASMTSPSPGAIQVGPVGATKRFCTGEVGEGEQQFFAALGKASHYTLEGGNLVLTWEKEGQQGPGRLIFTARPAAG
jgi:heat shock protein HslJ